MTKKMILIYSAIVVFVGVVLFVGYHNVGWWDTTCEEGYKGALASGTLGLYCLTIDKDEPHCTDEMKEKARKNFWKAVDECKSAKKKHAKCSDEYDDWLSCLAKASKEFSACESVEKAKQTCIYKNYSL